MQYKVVASSILYPEIKETGSKKNPTYKVLDTHINLEWLLSHFKAEIKYNLMTRQREIIIPGHFISQEDQGNSALALIDYLCVINDMPTTKKLNAHIDQIALRNFYHPIVEFIKNNPWDGIKRLDSFANTIQSDNQILTNHLIKTWMISAIIAAHSTNGFASQGVLVIQGKQKIGKTEWLKCLDPINCGAVKDGATLDPRNKDIVLSLAGHWIVELGELDATFGKSDIARLKSFITSASDNIRAPYARLENKLPRRTVYAATVNTGNYLVDDTGNRRWWTIAANSINLDHGLDIGQVWAEVYAEWQANASPYLTRDIQHQIDQLNIEHELINPLEEKLLTFYDWSRPSRQELTATQILEDMGYERPNKSIATMMGNVLIKLNKKKPRKSNDVRLHSIPYRKYPESKKTLDVS